MPLNYPKNKQSQMQIIIIACSLATIPYESLNSAKTALWPRVNFIYNQDSKKLAYYAFVIITKVGED